MQTAVLPLRIQIAKEAASILQLMPIPSYSSYQVVIQVRHACQSCCQQSPRCCMQYLLLYSTSAVQRLPLLLLHIDYHCKKLSSMLCLQVSGAGLLPSSPQKQNLITDTLLTLLASDHVFLIRLLEVDESSLPNNQGTVIMTYVMQKSSDTVAISTVDDSVQQHMCTSQSMHFNFCTICVAVSKYGKCGCMEQ